MDLEILFPRSKKILFKQNWSIIGRIWPWQCLNGICQCVNWYLHVNDKSFFGFEVFYNLKACLFLAFEASKSIFPETHRQKHRYDYTVLTIPRRHTVLKSEFYKPFIYPIKSPVKKWEAVGVNLKKITCHRYWSTC